MLSPRELFQCCKMALKLDLNSSKRRVLSWALWGQWNILVLHIRILDTPIRVRSTGNFLGKGETFDRQPINARNLNYWQIIYNILERHATKHSHHVADSDRPEKIKQNSVCFRSEIICSSKLPSIDGCTLKTSSVVSCLRHRISKFWRHTIIAKQPKSVDFLPHIEISSPSHLKCDCEIVLSLRWAKDCRACSSSSVS